MLTLDRITLFYHSLRQASQEKKKRMDTCDDSDDHNIIRSWSHDVKPSKPKKHTTAPSLASNSQKTVSTTKSRSSLSRSVLDANVGLKCTDKGLSSQSEVEGEEREVAKSSPIKPKKTRATSQVSLLLLFSVIKLSLLYLHRIWSDAPSSQTTISPLS